MADDIEQLKTEIAQVLEMFKTTMKNVVAEVSGATGSTIDGALDAAGQKARDVARDTVQEFQNIGPALDGIFGSAFSQAFGANWQNSVRSGLDFVRQHFSASNLALNFDTEALGADLEGVFGRIGQFASDPANAIDLTAVLGAEVAGHAIQTFLSPMDRLERRVMGFQSGTVDLFAGFSDSASSAARTVEDMDQRVTTFYTSVTNAGIATRLGADEARSALEALGRAGVDIRQFLDLRIETGNSVGEVNGLAAAMKLARGAGLDFGEVGGIITQGMRTFGLEGENAIRLFGTLKAAQDGTNLSFRDVASTVMEGASTLRFFGTNVDSVAAVYQSFVRTLGEGREALAGTLFQNVVSGLAQMNTGFRAFLGMTGEVGGGGAGGAVGGALRVEQALAEGNIEGIIGDLQHTMERFTGTQLLTREKAIGTGQEQQFFMQREILRQALGIGDLEQATNIMNMLAQGMQVGVAEIQRKAPGELQGVMDEGEAAINRQVGSVQRLANVIDSVGVNAMGRMSGSISKLSEVTGQFADNAGTQLLKFFRTMGAEPSTGSTETLTEEERTRRMEQAAAATSALPGGIGAAFGTMNAAGQADVLGGVGLFGQQGERGGLSVFGRTPQAAGAQVIGGVEVFGQAAEKAHSTFFNGFVDKFDLAGTTARDRLNEAIMPLIEMRNRADAAQGAQASRATRQAGDTNVQTAKVMLDNDEITLKIAIDADDANINIRPYIDQAGNEAKQIARRLMIDQADGILRT